MSLESEIFPNDPNPISITEELARFDIWVSHCCSHNKKSQISTFFNNFRLYVPGGATRRQLLDEKSKYLDWTFEDMNPDCSELLKSQKLREFYFRTVDDVFKNLGLYNRVVALNTDKTLNELTFAFLPGYIKLREMGYLRYPDLIS